MIIYGRQSREIKMKKSIVLVLLCTIVVTSCNLLYTDSSGNSNGLTVMKTKTFNVSQFSSPNSIATYATIEANLVKETSHLEIYVKKGQMLSDKDLEHIAGNFEFLYKPMTDVFGTHTDRDGNGKIIILLYDINTGDTSGAYIAGFFNRGDILHNNTEILYVESQVSNDIENIFSTIIHEFQHLINASMDIKTQRPTNLWLNEALSASAEILIFDKMTSLGPIIPLNRWATYNDENYGNLISEGNYFYNWNYYDASVSADYATVSLFMYWLYLHGGEEIIKDIAFSDESGKYTAILDAVQKSDSNTLKRNSSWEDILFSWLNANENENEGYPSAKTGFMKDNFVYSNNSPFFLESKVYSGSKKSVHLYPGDAVLTSLTFTGNNLVNSEINENLNITLNNDTAILTTFVLGEENPSTEITLPQASVIARSVKREQNLFPDVKYRIVSLPQKPYSTEDLRAVKQ